MKLKSEEIKQIIKDEIANNKNIGSLTADNLFFMEVEKNKKLFATLVFGSLYTLF